ncbi:ectoine/hydroxyectoine ABC transporter permease subunit EhuD [Paenibacillus sp. IB182496]|uniref:Ectoine/hydroxyectoine ABC transporter permease subunit EhuD n=1 Tax=Paenibacillus sabuli TaxID=2772509 RepID=A0A927GSF4_9BACL|nr:ectoine/hydroxyectoine ABC transporter permease subunit EhuD [Paenibacillus sabuli]MBD2845657.1 ectoine/hydroxyectoine ABC transporter permease subunit EhuD [Paenibacillus sabuli]
MELDWEYAFSILPTLLKGLKTALYATVVGFVIACVAGLVLALLVRVRVKVVKWVTNAFIEFVRSTPLLIQLFFLYFGLNKYFQLSAFTVGAVALGIHYSTYLAEVYRSGIDNVEKGQWEASRALNFSKGRTWTSIILPQAIPPILPIMGNYLIVVFKETPLLAGITVLEMLTRSKNILSRDWKPFEPYTMVGLIFLVLSLTMAIVFELMERRMNRRFTK